MAYERTNKAELLQANEELESMRAKLDAMITLVEQTPGMNRTIADVMTEHLGQADDMLRSLSGWFELLARDGE